MLAGRKRGQDDPLRDIEVRSDVKGLARRLRDRLNAERSCIVMQPVDELSESAILSTR